MKKNNYDIIIIGGGASGLMCAASLNLTGKARGLILDAGPITGRKLLMSGNGRCNLTHSGSIKDFTAAYGQGGKKIRKLLYRHSNDDMCKFYSRLGIELVEEADGRMFPSTGSSRDVHEALLKQIDLNGWDVRTETYVKDICPSCEDSLSSDGSILEYSVQAGSEADTSVFSSRFIVLAPGGITYPSTGSDGSVHRIIQRRLPGVELTELKPALAPIAVLDYPYSELAGITLDKVRITLKGHGVKDSISEGGLLFTHQDFSGPAALAASAGIYEASELVINYLAPDFTSDSKEIMRKLQTFMGKGHGSLAGFISSEYGIPKKLAKALIERACDSPKKLASLLISDTFRLSEELPSVRKAMVTRGGIPLSKSGGADPRTLELDGYPGCYAIGELLDIDGITGGYNLQFAYSSARAVSDELCLKLELSVI